MVEYGKVKKNGVYAVRFSYRSAGTPVLLTGSFNDWDDLGIEMTTAPSDPDRSEVVLQLAPGYYEYKFIVNGRWIPDEENPGCAANDFGTLNSVLNLED